MGCIYNAQQNPYSLYLIDETHLKNQKYACSFLSKFFIINKTYIVIILLNVDPIIYEFDNKFTNTFYTRAQITSFIYSF